MKPEQQTFKKVCTSQTQSFFKKGEMVLSFNDKNHVGIVLEGKAHVGLLGTDGHENITESLHIGDIFGYHLFSRLNPEDYRVVADTDCVVALINYDNVVHKCETQCKNHTELVNMLLMQTLTRVRELSAHVGILSQRSIRGKLEAYFDYQKMRTNGKNRFRLPMTLGDLADFLCVDRAAMMREIKKMNEEGFIESKGRDITLLSL